MGENFTREDVRAIVKETVRETVADLFDRLGIDLNDREAIERYRQDMGFLRKQRRGSEDIAKAVRWTAIGAFVAGASWVALWGLQRALGGGA